MTDFTAEEDPVTSASTEKSRVSLIQFHLQDVRNLGVVAHYWSMGFIFGAVKEVMVGIFEGYLNMPGYLFSVAVSICNMPMMFTFLYGLVTDALPICGLHRKPYLIAGWFITTVALLPTTIRPMPLPYWCVSSDYTYEKHEAPCNPEAQDDYHLTIASFFLGVLGASMANSAAAGLLVDFAKHEPEEKRGTAQLSLHMVNLLGSFCATFVTAFGFNGSLYTGSFPQDDQLDFREFSGVLLGISSVTFMITCFCVQEPSWCKVPELGEQVKAAWAMLKNKSFFLVLLYNYLNSASHAFNSPATGYVGLQWADVKMLQRQMAALISILATLVGTWLSKKYLLQTSWRKILFWTSLLTTTIDAVQQLCTTFNVVRSPYFYLGEPLVTIIPDAADGLVTTLLVNELADDGNGALVAGILSTVDMIAAPIGTTFSNQIFGLFKPDLSLRKNFIEDTAHFRKTVAWSYALQSGLAIASLALIPLLPRQKIEAQLRKQEWGSHRVLAIATVAVLLLSLAYSLLVDFVALDPNLSCMRFVGGPGC